MQKTNKYIACQGREGAFSHLVAKELFPESDQKFYSTFDQAIEAVESQEAVFGVLPVENSSAGRVVELHRLLAKTSLQVVGEYFYKIHHHLLGLPDAELSDIRLVRSHAQALSQCANSLKQLGVMQEAVSNTAFAAEDVALKKERSVAAIASHSACALYGLKVLKENIEDSPFNMTRFWILSKTEKTDIPFDNAITSFIFWVKNKPAVLYKCLGGFATHGIDLLRLESFVSSDDFLCSAGFLVDVRAHKNSPAFLHALEELSFFARDVKILGTYAPDKYRVSLQMTKKDYE